MKMKRVKGYEVVQISNYCDCYDFECGCSTDSFGLVYVKQEFTLPKGLVEESHKGNRTYTLNNKTINLESEFGRNVISPDDMEDMINLNIFDVIPLENRYQLANKRLDRFFSDD